MLLRAEVVEIRLGPREGHAVVTHHQDEGLLQETGGAKGFEDLAERIKAASEQLRRQGVRIQVVVIHEGTAQGNNAAGTRPATARPSRFTPTTS